jgi:hypothetical protein
MMDPETQVLEVTLVRMPELERMLVLEKRLLLRMMDPPKTLSLHVSPCHIDLVSIANKQPSPTLDHLPNPLSVTLPPLSTLSPVKPPVVSLL